MFLGAISRYPLYLFLAKSRSFGSEKKDAVSIGARGSVFELKFCFHLNVIQKFTFGFFFFEFSTKFRSNRTAFNITNSP